MINDGMFTSNTDDWETPQWLFDRLNWIFGFDLDVCASDENHKCDRYFTAEQDGLKNSWGGCKCWCNPPYGRQIGKWVEKAARSVEETDGTLVVMLIPARTDTRWYHEYIAHNPMAHAVFLKGRLTFGRAKHNAPFPSMVVVFGRIQGG